MSGYVLRGRLLQSLLEDGEFSNIDISQGSVATYLRCGGIFKYQFVANLPLSLSAKELCKSVIIWGSYGQEFSVLFFIDSRCSWLVTYRDGIPARRRSPIPVLTGPNVD